MIAGNHHLPEPPRANFTGESGSRSSAANEENREMTGAEWLQTGSRGGNQRPSVSQSAAESARRLRRRSIWQEHYSSR